MICKKQKEKMKMKKFIAVLMAFAMALSLGVTAFAAIPAKTDLWNNVKNNFYLSNSNGEALVADGTAGSECFKMDSYEILLSEFGDPAAFSEDEEEGYVMEAELDIPDSSDIIDLEMKFITDNSNNIVRINVEGIYKVFKSAGVYEDSGLGTNMSYLLGIPIKDASDADTGLAYTVETSFDSLFLTIGGSGAIPDYNYLILDEKSDAPWADITKDLFAVNIASGVTKIGKYAFVGAEDMYSMEIFGEETEVEENAIDGCNINVLYFCGKQFKADGTTEYIKSVAFSGSNIGEFQVSSDWKDKYDSGDPRKYGALNIVYHKAALCPFVVTKADGTSATEGEYGVPSADYEWDPYDNVLSIFKDELTVSMSGYRPADASILVDIASPAGSYGKLTLDSVNIGYDENMESEGYSFMRGLLVGSDIEITLKGDNYFISEYYTPVFTLAGTTFKFTGNGTLYASCTDEEGEAFSSLFSTYTENENMTVLGSTKCLAKANELSNVAFDDDEGTFVKNGEDCRTILIIPKLTNEVWELMRGDGFITEKGERKILLSAETDYFWADDSMTNGCSRVFKWDDGSGSTYSIYLSAFDAVKDENGNYKLTYDNVPYKELLQELYSASGMNVTVTGSDMMEMDISVLFGKIQSIAFYGDDLLIVNNDTGETIYKKEDYNGVYNLVDNRGTTTVTIGENKKTEPESAVEENPDTGAPVFEAGSALILFAAVLAITKRK